MEILIKIIVFALFLMMIFIPILILKQLYKRKVKNNFIPYILFSLTITFLLILIIGWWSNFSTHFLLSHYRYNFEALNETERFQNVAIKNLEKVKTLRTSILGIGWPIKACMSYSFYFPYLLIVYFSSYFYKIIKQKSN
jgi:general stress protein CsbA